MKRAFSANLLVVAVVAVNSAVLGWLAFRKPAAPPENRPSETRVLTIEESSDDRMRAMVDALGDRVRQLEEDETAIAERIDALGAQVARLQSSFDGISLEDASEDRQQLFAAEEGYLKADEYFEAGKFGIAGEGYLTFLRHHPDHPDVKGVLERARVSFQRAGYMDKAIWVQEAMLERFPENRAENLSRLSKMAKSAGRMDDAIRHVTEAAEVTKNTQDRYWHLMYRAYYIQLRDGDSAGLDAYREVQQQIADAGLSEHRLGERAEEMVRQLQRQVEGAR